MTAHTDETSQDSAKLRDGAGLPENAAPLEKTEPRDNAEPQENAGHLENTGLLETTGDRPLRRDAERNRRRILAAAAEVFTERGLDATLDEVARVAGVGVGTVYRRFPGKESLVAALFRDRIDALVTVAEEACAAPDPWLALTGYLEYVAAAMADDLGLRQLMMFGTYDRDQLCYARDRMNPVIGRLVRRAKVSGDLRADFTPTDVKMISLMIASIAQYTDPVVPGIWRRYLAMLIDGLRPARDDVSPLPAPAPTPAELSVLMHPPALH